MSAIALRSVPHGTLLPFDIHIHAAARFPLNIHIDLGRLALDIDIDPVGRIGRRHTCLAASQSEDTQNTENQ